MPLFNALKNYPMRDLKGEGYVLVSSLRVQVTMSGKTQWVEGAEAAVTWHPQSRRER